jgi:hypothetical protein
MRTAPPADDPDMQNKRIAVMVLSAAVLAVPTVAAAKPGGKGAEHHAKHESKQPGTSHKPKQDKQAKKVMFVFKGTFTAPGTVKVVSGNSHVRKGGFVGQDVAFDLAGAKIVVADTNGDGKTDVTDVKDGDKVLVQARVAKRTRYAAPAEGETAAALVARKLVDKASKPADDQDESEPAPTTEAEPVS